ncbi:titin-like protein isoform X3 [Cucumis melo var. makuwa]|uniref:Titin-like protein isoform X3 n=1 Tax=Cucumis melo var. makuwa TaxID=1194695 RepID=A0A5A7VG88_CUCMM|nr:titin-like protein isoform X3 [Cucumis melo var. makuwa]TYK27925.1 titin-like protein isoform X3 [Cucumis melo var. makuwa]
MIVVVIFMCNETIIDRLETFHDESVIELARDGVASETWKDDGVKIDVKPQLTSSLLNDVDGEVALQGHVEAEEINLRKADVASVRQHSNRSDLFAQPSFMKLVEPNGDGIPSPDTTEIQTARNQE